MNADAQPQSLPLVYRAASGARRVLGRSGTRAIYRSRLARPLRRALDVAAPSGMRFVEVCGGPLAGARMRVDLAHEKYYWLGTHEEELQVAACEMIRPGATVFDAGAHAGFFTLLFARLAGRDGRVVAFEPLAANVSRLRENIAANDLGTVDVHQAALTDGDGVGSMRLYGSSLEATLAERDAGSIDVATRTLDGLVAAGVPAPSLIKIDVEGAEARVLRGGRNVVERYRPALLIEIHSEAVGRDVVDALPVRYEFRALDGEVTPGALAPGHYVGKAA